MKHLDSGFRFVVHSRLTAFLAVIFLQNWAVECMAINFVSSEDRSRFSEESYKKAAPGMRSPAEYAAMASRAITSKYDVFLDKEYTAPVVTRRYYRDAPKADQDIICVSYVFRRLLGGGGTHGTNGIFSKPNQDRPVLQALIRRDGSKIYVHMITYKQE